MPQFKNFNQTDDAPPIPEGWMFVELNRDKMKIVDNQGNSMSPYSRALVQKDAMSNALVDEGVLVVISEATVSLENYVEEPKFHSNEMALKMQFADQSANHDDDADAIRTSSVPSEAEIAAKEEQIKKPRKKKSVDASSGETDIAFDEETSNSEVETSTTDTSASEEEPSV